MRTGFFALLLVALGLGYAQTPAEVVNVGDNEAIATENIEVTVPPRVALHITETQWDLDLNSPPLGSYETGEGCFLVPKDFGDYNDDGTVDSKDVFDAYQDGNLQPIDTYPAIYDFDNDGRIGGNEKGTLVCINKKIVQKFCNNWVSTAGQEDGNSTGCEFDLKVNIQSPYPLGDASYGRLFFHDRPEPLPVGDLTFTPFLEVTPGNGDDGSPIEWLKIRGGRFAGWLDDYITEGFWFDGTETAGTYVFTITFRIDPI